MKIIRQPQCSVIVQPGEYLIDRWDNKRCQETNKHYLVKCNVCEEYFCLLKHWPDHTKVQCVKLNNPKG